MMAPISFVVFQHRDADQGTRTCEVDSGFAQLISGCWYRCYVGEMVIFFRLARSCREVPALWQEDLFTS